MALLLVLTGMHICRGTVHHGDVESSIYAQAVADPLAWADLHSLISIFLHGVDTTL